MNNDILKVLVLSRGNSSRSQIVEGFLRSYVGNHILPVSAGIESSHADPLANEVMKEVGIDISDLHPEEVSSLFRDTFRYVVAICDGRKERFPIFPFTPNLLHWSLQDPDELAELEERRHAFRRVRDEIRRKVKEFIASINRGSPEKIFAEAHKRNLTHAA